MDYSTFTPDWLARLLREGLNQLNLNRGDFLRTLREDTCELREEFHHGPVSEFRNQAVERLEEAEISTPGTIPEDVNFALYACVRTLKPDVIVETGVANGLSSLHFLAALQRNGHGQLYSVDFPFRADADLETFRNETFEGYGGAHIPPDEDPGWLIPEELRSRWSLAIGKSQTKLPKLFRELEQEVDVFFHDSEHSTSAMLFEYELAWNHLSSGGYLISDDVKKSQAFKIFERERNPQKSGYVTRIPPVGYFQK